MRHAVLVWCGCVAGNLIVQAMTNGDYAVAIDRSLFQGIGFLVLWITITGDVSA